MRRPQPIQVAIVIGQHWFEVLPFHDLWRSLANIEFYVQDLGTFASDKGGARQHYDVIVFYNFHLRTPGNDDAWWAAGMRDALETLGETAQGLLVWHHTLSAFPRREFWSDLVGIPHAERQFDTDNAAIVFDREISSNETIQLEIADPDHPITRGLTPFSIIGETYGNLLSDPGPDSHVLLRTQHPKMRLSAMCWTRRFRNAPVVCLHPGHDPLTWEHASFREVLGRSVGWLAEQR